MNAATDVSLPKAHELRARINDLALRCKVRSSSPAEAAEKKSALKAAEVELTALHMATENAAAAARSL